MGSWILSSTAFKKRFGNAILVTAEDRGETFGGKTYMPFPFLGNDYASVNIIIIITCKLESSNRAHFGGSIRHDDVHNCKRAERN